MDPDIFEFYRKASDELPKGHFHEVLPLKEKGAPSFDECKWKAPSLDKGWYELSKLSQQDRLEFTREFWISKLGSIDCADLFFQNLEDIGIFLVQPHLDAPFEPHMVYCLKNKAGFYKGSPPAKESDLLDLKKKFPLVTFPEDYLAFIMIHNGFAKATDTGVLKVQEIERVYTELKSYINNQPSLLMCGEQVADPSELIPFYQSFGMPFYQCFWTAWYPELEMGNVYYSSTTNTISRLSSEEACAENLTFHKFTDWLAFYLEQVEKKD